MALRTYKPFMKLLTLEEQSKMFDIIKTYHTALNKPAEDWTRKENDFITFRPHDVNEWLTVDILEREIVFIPDKQKYMQALNEYKRLQAKH